MRITAAILLFALPLPAVAAPDDPPRIVVTGTATTRSAPDRATIAYGVRGEGTNADDAVKALNAKRVAIETGLARFAGTSGPTTGQVAVNELRGRECQAYPPSPSVGACAVQGYRAEIEVEVRTSAVKDAGTIVGVIGRAGGTNPRLSGFGLTDDQPARAKAAAEAFAAARRQAEALAAAGGVRLGRLLSATDGSFAGRPDLSDDIIVTAHRVTAPPPPPPPPVPVDLTPRPIETQARVTVAYEVLP